MGSSTRKVDSKLLPRRWKRSPFSPLKSGESRSVGSTFGGSEHLGVSNGSKVGAAIYRRGQMNPTSAGSVKEGPSKGISLPAIVSQRPSTDSEASRRSSRSFPPVRRIVPKRLSIDSKGSKRSSISSTTTDQSFPSVKSSESSGDLYEVSTFVVVPSEATDLIGRGYECLNLHDRSVLEI